MLHSGSAASARSTLRAGLLEMFGAVERWNGPSQREGKNNPFPIGFGRVGTDIKSTANTKEKSQKKGKKSQNSLVIPSLLEDGLGHHAHGISK